MTSRRYELPEEFQDAVDRFIHLANEIGDDRNPDWVRAVLMFAAARYNAFSWINRDADVQQTEEQALAYFRTEYETMLRENLKELGPVYAQARSQEPKQ